RVATGANATVISSVAAKRGGTNCRGRIWAGCFCITRTLEAVLVVLPPKRSGGAAAVVARLDIWTKQNPSAALEYPIAELIVLIPDLFPVKQPNVFEHPTRPSAHVNRVHPLLAFRVVKARATDTKPRAGCQRYCLAETIFADWLHSAADAIGPRHSQR